MISENNLDETQRVQLRQLLEDAHVLVERCKEVVKDLESATNYDANSRRLDLQTFIEQLTEANTGLRRAALHASEHGRLL